MNVNDKSLPGPFRLAVLAVMTLFLAGFLAPFFAGLLLSSGKAGGIGKAVYGMLTVLVEFDYWKSPRTYYPGLLLFLFSAAHAARVGRSAGLGRWLADYFAATVAATVILVAYLVVTTPGWASMREISALLVFYGFPILFTLVPMCFIWRDSVSLKGTERR